MLDQEPPSSSTGAENPVPMVALIDWLTFTLPVIDPLKVCELIGIVADEFIKMPKGGNGYLTQVKCGDITILSAGTVEMGCHVVFSGKGCRQYEARFGNVWPDLIKKVFDQGGQFARIDVALDEFDKRLSLAQIWDKVEKREIVSRFTKVQKQVEADLKTPAGENAGYTIYFGSKQSLLFIRFYDKAKEQEVDYPWIRVEIVCRDSRAELLATAILSGQILSEITAGVLKNYLKFVDPSDDTNKSRWPVSKWWSDFIGDVEKIRLTIRKEEISIQEKKDHLTRQYAPTFAMINKLDGNNDFQDGLVRNGKLRLKPRHYAMLNGAIEEKAALKNERNRGDGDE